MIQIMVRRGYDSDPVKAWKLSQEKDKVSLCATSTLKLLIYRYLGNSNLMFHEAQRRAAGD